MECSSDYYYAFLNTLRTGPMQKNNEQSQLHTLDSSPLQVSQQVKLDLRVLRYMAHSVHFHLLHSALNTTLPSIDYLEERRERTHRVVIYQQQEYILQAS